MRKKQTKRVEIARGWHQRTKNTTEEDRVD